MARAFQGVDLRRVEGGRLFAIQAHQALACEKSQHSKCIFASQFVVHIGLSAELDARCERASRWLSKPVLNQPIPRAVTGLIEGLAAS
ncbi:hypothetical protein D9M68_897500 [compost metagenome]